MRGQARVWAGRLLAVMAVAVIGVVVVNGQKSPRIDPLPAFLFRVDIAGQSTGFFKSVGGLSMETEVVDYQEGGVTGPIRKLAGVTRYANIRLTRAFTGDRSLFDWHATIQKPNPIRVDGRITLMDRHGTPIATWKFVNAFPVKWEGPDLDASKNEVAIETIEIAHEGLTFADDNEPPPPPK
jgi:phage tail-like protein